MPKPNRTLPFDFAKDFDCEDEEKKRVEREQQKKEAAELRRSAEKFVRALKRSAKKSGRQVDAGGVCIQTPNSRQSARR